MHERLDETIARLKATKMSPAERLVLLADTVCLMADELKRVADEVKKERHGPDTA